MITKFTTYIKESRKSIDELEVLTPDQLGKLMFAEIVEDFPDVQYIQDLLDVGCPIDIKDGYDRAPLDLAAQRMKLEIIKLLISNGADVNARNRDGWTTFHHLAFAERPGVVEIIKLLISNGADIHIKDKWGKTALHLAANYGKIAMIRYLVSIGADIEVRDYGNKSPWDYANRDIKEALPELNPNA